MRRLWLAYVALCACTAPESGNPAERCDDTGSCPGELFCYRGFCVEDEQELDPVTATDAGVVTDAGSAWSEFDSVLAAADAARAVDTSPTDAGPVQAVPVQVAPVAEPVRDAGLPCLLECIPPQQSLSSCKKCVKSVFGDDPDKLCGKQGGRGDDKVLAANNAICAALCLGVGATNPSCQPLLCHGPKCGDLP